LARGARGAGETADYRIPGWSCAGARWRLVACSSSAKGPRGSWFNGPLTGVASGESCWLPSPV